MDNLNVYFGSNHNKIFSNLAKRPFTYENNNYLSVEHAYQTLKSGKFDKLTFDKYDHACQKIPGNTQRCEDYKKIMRNLILQSFIQNPPIRRKFVRTLGRRITHLQDSGEWRFLFPKIMMSVRRELNRKYK